MLQDLGFYAGRNPNFYDNTALKGLPFWLLSEPVDIIIVQAKGRRRKIWAFVRAYSHFAVDAAQKGPSFWLLSEPLVLSFLRQRVDAPRCGRECGQIFATAICVLTRPERGRHVVYCQSQLVLLLHGQRATAASFGRWCG